MALRSDKVFDTHCHLNDERFDEDREEIIKNVESELSGCICVGADFPSSLLAIELAERSGQIFAAVGVHPHDVKSMDDNMLCELSRLLKHERVVALGEVGLDYYYEYSDRETQKQWFIRQLDLSIESKMPVIIHLRDAYGDMMDILRGYKNKLPEGVLHCFSGSKEIAKEVLAMGFHISFTGAITFKNAENLREVVKYVPLDRMLVETDAPYLSPAPHRGERNNPLYVKHVAEQVAQVKGIGLEEVIKETTRNAIDLFRLDMKNG